MRKYTNSEICEMIDNGTMEDGDRVYVMPSMNELLNVNDEINKKNKLYNTESYYEYLGWCDTLVAVNMGYCEWSPEKGTKWTLNEKVY